MAKDETEYMLTALEQARMCQPEDDETHPLVGVVIVNDKRQFETHRGAEGSACTNWRGSGLAMIHKFFVALGIRTFTSGLPGLAPLPQLSLSTRLSINNSGRNIDLLVMSLQQPASGRSLDSWPRPGTSRRGGGRLSNN
jgi:hypothetical protein